MAMEKIFEPGEHEFISPVVNFGVFKERALSARNELRNAVKLPELASVSYPESIPTPPAYVRKTRFEDVIVKKEIPVSVVVDNIVSALDLPVDDINAAAERLGVMDSLAVMNNRDILFRKKVEKQDIPADAQLETLKIRRRILEGYNPIKKKPLDKYSDPEERERDRQMRTKIFSQLHHEGTILKYGDYMLNEIKHSRSGTPVETSVDDIVVTLNILKPHNRPLDQYERRNIKLEPYWKYVIRGDNSLLDVHALFKCSSDYGTKSDLGDVVPKLEDFNFMRYPSSFIFINDTFYIQDFYSGMTEVVKQLGDIPLTQLQDISEPIRKWMGRKKDSFGPTQVKSIINSQIKDITCRLGYPYVYVHQGYCEHVFFFSDLRLMDSQDYPESYPHKVADESVANYCYACHRNLAEHIVESDRLPVCPAHMCSECYHGFFYDGDRRSETESKSYFYADPSSLAV